MKDQLTQIIIGRALYNIDFDGGKLIRTDNPNDYLSFDSLVQKSDGYYCSYNSRGLIEYASESRSTALIPKQVIDDSKPYDKAFAANFNELSYRTKGGALLIDEKIENRLNGKLPTIDIEGNRFIVDWCNQELRSEKNPHNKISWKDLVEGPGDVPTYSLYYHLPSQKAIKKPENIVVVQHVVVIASIPNEMHLDPIGVAIRYKFNPASFLRWQPVQENFKARIYPINLQLERYFFNAHLQKFNQVLKKAAVPKKKRGHQL